MRIAQIAPIAVPVRSDSDGSIEQLVNLLTRVLVERGHDVTLFATGDSETPARLHATYAEGWLYDVELEDWQFREYVHAAAAFERAHEFDVIHSHDYQFAIPFSRLVKTPAVHTYHIMPDNDVTRTFAQWPEAHLVAISAFQRRELSIVSQVDVVHNGVDTDAFPFSAERGDYLLFLGRLLPRKGPVEAIEIARAAGMPIRIAGGGDEDYYRNEILPHVDGENVTYLGHVSAAERNLLLARAAALLFPLQYPEPFGLVMIEAMACGTPVLALDCGPVSEIVRNGVTGYYASDIDGLIALLPSALALDRETIRAEAVRCYDYRRMATEYEALYERLLQPSEPRSKT